MEFNELLGDISKEILDIKTENVDSFSELHETFFDIMRKYNIRKYNQTGNGGLLGDTYQWTICRILFESVIHDKLTMNNIFGDVPEDIKC